MTTTCIYNLQQGRSLGCTCNSALANHWRNRRSEIVAIGKDSGFEVVTTQDVWMQECDGNRYCPTLRCVECDEEVTTTCIYNLQQGRSLGCTCNSSLANHWRNRRSEIVAIGKDSGFEVVTTQDVWVQECDGNRYCPTIRCVECEEEVTTTCVSSLRKGHVGCTCHKKTERKLGRVAANSASRRHDHTAVQRTRCDPLRLSPGVPGRLRGARRAGRPSTLLGWPKILHRRGL